MRARLIAGAALCGVSVTLVLSPSASADSCDPQVAACPNYGAQAGADDPSLAFSPTTIADDDQFPFDGGWYIGDVIDSGRGGGGHGR